MNRHAKPSTAFSLIEQYKGDPGSGLGVCKSRCVKKRKCKANSMYRSREEKFLEDGRAGEFGIEQDAAKNSQRDGRVLVAATVAGLSYWRK